jgi:hypothetical protein
MNDESSSGGGFSAPEPSFSQDVGLSHHQHMAGLAHHEFMASSGANAPSAEPIKPNVLHLILTLLSGGLWLPVWIYFAFFRKKTPPPSGPAA